MQEGQCTLNKHEFRKIVGNNLQDIQKDAAACPLICLFGQF